MDNNTNPNAKPDTKAGARLVLEEQAPDLLAFLDDLAEDGEVGLIPDPYVPGVWAWMRHGAAVCIVWTHQDDFEVAGWVEEAMDA